MTTSPNQLSLNKLRHDGWQAEIVERWNAHSRTRHDLFNFIDIVAVRGTVTLGVQATSSSNVAARIRKIADSDMVAAVREAGWEIQVWGWTHKGKGAPYLLRVVDVS